MAKPKTAEDTATPKQEHILAQALTQIDFYVRVGKLREAVGCMLITVLNAESKY